MNVEDEWIMYQWCINYGLMMDWWFIWMMDGWWKVDGYWTHDGCKMDGWMVNQVLMNDSSNINECSINDEQMMDGWWMKGGWVVDEK
jgi:hypothetical protein